MNALRKFAKAVANLAKELTDENAYERYLAVSGRRKCGEEWRRFSDARLRRKYQNGKCC
jgi:hypothetical protein